MAQINIHLHVHLGWGFGDSMKSLPRVSSTPASTTALPQSQQGVDHDRNRWADCGSRGRTLLSCPCSICHLLVAIYTALIAGWDEQGVAVTCESLRGTELKKERSCWVLMCQTEPGRESQLPVTARGQLCRHGISAEPRPSSGTENPWKIPGKFPPGLSSRALIAACFIQPVPPVLCVVLYMFSIFKACFSWQCFFCHFHTMFFFFFPCLSVPDKMWFCALFSYGCEISGCPLKWKEWQKTKLVLLSMVAVLGKRLELYQLGLCSTGRARLGLTWIINSYFFLNSIPTIDF